MAGAATSKRIVLILFVLLTAAVIPLAPPEWAYSDNRCTAAPGNPENASVQFNRYPCYSPIAVTGPLDFAAAVGEAVAYLYIHDRPACRLVTGHIASVRTSPDTVEARVAVKTAEILFPVHWDYRVMDHEELADILVREAVHVWLYRNDYRFEGLEEDPHGIERLVQRYITLNRVELPGVLLSTLL